MNNAIFIDLDGTLLNDNREVSQRNLMAISHAKSLGHEVVICTGRALNFATRVAEKINASYVIYANGCIYDCKNKKVIYETQMPTGEILRVADVTDRKDVNTYFPIGFRRHLIKNLTFNGALYLPEDVVIEGSLRDFLEQHSVAQMQVISTDAKLMQEVKTDVEQILSVDSSIKISEQSRSLTNPRARIEKLTYFKLCNKNSTNNIIRDLQKLCKYFSLDVCWAF